MVKVKAQVDFYPRPPGGGRHRKIEDYCDHIKFLSTPSGWRATSGYAHHLTYHQDFYPRPPGGGRPGDRVKREGHCSISIHALRVEGDDGKANGIITIVEFLSTPSGWRATTKDSSILISSWNFYPRPPGGGRLLFTAPLHHILIISIHALRVEGDLLSLIRSLLSPNFYPRPPGGGRQGERE